MDLFSFVFVFKAVAYRHLLKLGALLLHYHSCYSVMLEMVKYVIKLWYANATFLKQLHYAVFWVTYKMCGHSFVSHCLEKIVGMLLTAFGILLSTWWAYFSAGKLSVTA